MAEQGAYEALPVAGPQQWKPVVVYTFHCLRCDKTLADPEWAEFGTPAWFSGETAIWGYETLEQSGWADIDGSAYCPDCFHTCWDVDEQPRLGSEIACALCREAAKAEVQA